MRRYLPLALSACLIGVTSAARSADMPTTAPSMLTPVTRVQSSAPIVQPIIPAPIDPDTARANATVSTFDRNNDEIAILTQEEKIWTLKKSISDAKRTVPKNDGGLADEHDPTPITTPATAPIAMPHEPALPRVVSIMGDAHRMTAQVVTSDGAMMTVQRGTGLGNGLTVSAIGDDGVTVQGPKGSQALPFDIGPAPVETATQVQGGSGVSPDHYIPGLTAVPVGTSQGTMPRVPPFPGAGGRS